MIFISLSLVQLHGKEIESLGIVFSLKAVGWKKEKGREKNEEGTKGNEIIVLWGRENILRGTEADYFYVVSTGKLIRKTIARQSFSPLLTLRRRFDSNL